MASAGPYASLHPRSRQITTPAPHHWVFYRPDALPAAQPTASKHWRECSNIHVTWKFLLNSSLLLQSYSQWTGSARKSSRICRADFFTGQMPFLSFNQVEPIASRHSTSHLKQLTINKLNMYNGWRLWLNLSTITTTTLGLFSSLFSRTTWVSWYQKGKTSLDLNDVNNHTNISSLNFYRPDALPDAQPTASKHCTCPQLMVKVSV